MTADELVRELEGHATEEEQEKVSRFYKGDDPKTASLGVRFGTVFETAKRYKALPLGEIETLLESDYYEVRMAGVSVMDFKARSKKLPDADRKALFDLYLRRHDRIDNWDLVDRAAPHVIGGYLMDKPRDVLYDLARSENRWERRTALYATLLFVRRGDVDDALALCELLLNDEEELVNKAVGTMLREVGKKDQAALLSFLDRFAADMSRVTLRYATEKLDKRVKERYTARPSG